MEAVFGGGWSGGVEAAFAGGAGGAGLVGSGGWMAGAGLDVGMALCGMMGPETAAAGGGLHVG